MDPLKDHFGVEGICVTLAGTEPGFITSRGYRAAETRPVCARQLSDELRMQEFSRIHGAESSVYWANKMHALMRRAEWDIGRDQIAHLMRNGGLRRAIRSRQPLTANLASKVAGLFSDLAQRR